MKGHLTSLPIEIASFDEYDRQKPKTKEQTKLFKQIQKVAINLKEKLKNKDSLLTKRENSELSELLLLTCLMGSTNMSAIAREHKSGYATITNLKKFLDFFHSDSGLNDFIKSLDEFIKSVDEAIKHLPEVKPGRPEENRELGLIHKILYIYTNGTNKKAVCYYHPEKEQYTGDFYLFLLRVLSILRRVTSIKQLKPETWGDKAHEVTQHHYNKVKKSN